MKRKYFVAGVADVAGGTCICSTPKDVFDSVELIVWGGITIDEIDALLVGEIIFAGVTVIRLALPESQPPAPTTPACAFKERLQSVTLAARTRLAEEHAAKEKDADEEMLRGWMILAGTGSGVAVYSMDATDSSTINRAERLADRHGLCTIVIDMEPSMMCHPARQRLEIRWAGEE